jgi:hypothetical protein
MISVGFFASDPLTDLNTIKHPTDWIKHLIEFSNPILKPEYLNEIIFINQSNP